MALISGGGTLVGTLTSPLRPEKKHGEHLNELTGIVFFWGGWGKDVNVYIHTHIDILTLNIDLHVKICM